QGGYDPGTGLWDVGTVPDAGTATLTLTARVVSPSPQTNTATITGADQFDPDPTNNSASTTETPQQADLALAKAASDPTPNVGDTVTFSVTLSNNGLDAATGVTVSDPLPAGLALVAATPSQGSYDPGSGTWAVGNVVPAVRPTLQIAAWVTGPNPAINVATIS